MEIFIKKKFDTLFQAILSCYGIETYYFIDHLPESIIEKSPGVYIFNYPIKYPHYIGSTINLKQRVTIKHEKYKPGLSVIIIPTPSIEIAADIENMLVVIFRASKNKIKGIRGKRK
jgi:hypothetical protein